MGRQREPIEVCWPFEYSALGRPAGAQRGETTTRYYEKWLDKLTRIVIEEADHVSRGRGLIPSNSLLKAQVIWLSIHSDAPDHPDLDNIIKPLFDALKTVVIADDKLIHHIDARKIDLNSDGLKLPEPVLNLQEDSEYRKGEVVYVRVQPLDFHADQWEWWK